MDGFTDAFNQNGSEEVDPAAEFLAREQSNLAGLVDDDNDQPTLLMNGLDSKPADVDESLFGIVADSEVDSGFEIVHHSAIETKPTINGGSLITETLFGSQSGGIGLSNSPSLFGTPREEPEKLRRWREDQKERLTKKDEEEERKKGEMKENARKELEEWYSNHDEQVAKNRTINREASKNAEKDLVGNGNAGEPGTEWERIAKLCDFNPKGTKHQKDISRMRSIILQVKQTPPVSAFQRKA